MAVSKQNMGSRFIAALAALSSGSCRCRCSSLPGLLASVQENCSSHACPILPAFSRSIYMYSYYYHHMFASL